MIKIKNILIVIMTLIYFISTGSAIEIKINESNNLDLYSDINIKKNIKRFNFKNKTGSVLGNSSLKLKTKITDSINLFNYINNDFYFNFKPYKKVLLSKLNIGYSEIIHDKFGSLSYGRNYGLIQDVLKLSDLGKNINNKFNKIDNFMFNRASNVLTYRNKNFFELVKGLNVNIQYQGKNPTIHLKKKHNKLINRGNGHGLGCSVSYDIDKFNISGAYFKSKRTSSQKKIDCFENIFSDNSNTVAYAVSCKYDYNNLYLSTLYSKNYFLTSYGNINNSLIRNFFEKKYSLCKTYYCGYANVVNNFEIVSKYKFKNGLESYIGYYNSLAKNIKGADQYLTNFIGMGSTYYINDNLSTFIDYKINLIKYDAFAENTNLDTENSFNIGLSYKF